MTKTCVICDKKIIEKKDKWVRLTDFFRGAQQGEVFYHLECWRDRFKISNSERKQAMYKEAQQALGSVAAMMAKAIDPEKKEVYEIARQ